MPLNNFEGNLQFWSQLLDRWPLEQLNSKYKDDKWSMGQLLLHVIDSSAYFLENVERCLLDREHADEETTETAKRIFKANELPAIEIKGPPSNDLTPQPTSISSMKEGLEALMRKVAYLRIKLQSDPPSGKIKHPGLGYFTAIEWFQFTDIHLRHHQRQAIAAESLMKSR